jgi:tetratricopeptide (TPR) repeat protein
MRRTPPFVPGRSRAFRTGLACALTIALGPRLLTGADSAGFDAARALYEEDKLGEARLAFERLALANPGMAEVHFHLGEIALRRNELETAVSSLERAVAAAPSVSRYHHRLGDAYGRAAQAASLFRAFGLAKRCLRAFQQAVELAPDNVDARFSLFMFYRGAPGFIGGGAEKAEAEATAIRRLDPDRGRIALAALRVSQKRYDDARAELAGVRAFDLTAVEADSVFLSDVRWTSANVGWGEPVRNHGWLDPRSGGDVVLIVHGRLYGKGLPAPSPARHVFAVDGRWSTLTATIGLRDGAGEQDSAVFVVRGDGRELFRSPILRANSSQRVKIDLAGVKELELVTGSGEPGDRASPAVWAEPLLRR